MLCHLQEPKSKSNDLRQRVHNIGSAVLFLRNSCSNARLSPGVMTSQDFLILYVLYASLCPVDHKN